MYNLDQILDEVREKYYASALLPRPTISWSGHNITAYYGAYHLYNNHITISSIFNSKDISYEAVSSVVYHESLHQDFADHDRKFSLRANKFPNYKELQKELEAFAQRKSATLEYDKQLSDYGRGYKEIIYIVLPYIHDYINAFTFYNGYIYIDCYSNVTSDNCLAVFLVDNGERYHIVSWASNVTLLRERISVEDEINGGKNFNYKAYAPRNDVHILFEQTCSYAIDKKSFTKEMQRSKYFVCDVDSEDAQANLNYMNTYCEGFYNLGLDPSEVNTATPYLSKEYKEIKKVALLEYGFRKLWASNALCEIKKCTESLQIKAEALRESGMIKLADEITREIER